MGTIDLIRATPNTVEAIRKAHAIRKDLRPDGSFQYSLPSSASCHYRGQWAVRLNDQNEFQVPASTSGNLILTEDRLFATVTNALTATGSVEDTGWSWCYLVVRIGNITHEPVITLEKRIVPASMDYQYASLLEDYIPLAQYSQETGLIQLQYGPVRLHRYWILEHEGSGGSGSGGEEL